MPTGSASSTRPRSTSSGNSPSSRGASRSCPNSPTSSRKNCARFTNANSSSNGNHDEQEDTMRIRWYGQSAFLIQGEHTVFLDPFGSTDGLTDRGLYFYYPPIKTTS